MPNDFWSISNEEMNSVSPPPRTPEISKEIDVLCDAFERDCKDGHQPRIEDLLPKVELPYRPILFRELLELEIELRLAAQTTDSLPDVDAPLPDILPLLDDPESEYRNRFPEYADLVSQVVCRIVQPKQLGDYELLREIGTGGMGVVYKAVQKYLNQLVAVKILPQRYSDDPQAVLRFRREMFLLGELNHPNIVRALYAGESKGLHYLVTELVDGPTLQDLMEKSWNRYLSGAETVREFRMPPHAACEVVRQAALGLAHFEQSGLVHRDIKPANLMIDGAGTVKLFDLGLGKFDFGDLTAPPTDSTLTQIGTMMGTFDYMAPEQWTDSATVDIRADIYSLGCTLYFMLTNTPPYGGAQCASKREKFLAHLSSPIPPLDDALHSLPMKQAEAIADIYRRMMAKDPAQRFQTPRELAEALESYADHRELTNFVNNVLDRKPSDVSVTDSIEECVTEKRNFRWLEFALGCAIGASAAYLIIGFLR